jgi:hypothetical protein
MPMVMLESFQEFANRQRMPDGRRAEWIMSRNGRHGSLRGFLTQEFLFENGASSNGAETHFAPPADARELLRAKKTFFEMCLKEDQRRWNEYRTDCLNQAELHRRFPNLPPGAGPHAIKLLEEGQERQARLQTMIDGLGKEIEALKTPQEREVEAAEAKRQEEQRERSMQLGAMAERIKSLAI